MASSAGRALSSPVPPGFTCSPSASPPLPEFPGWEQVCRLPPQSLCLSLGLLETNVIMPPEPYGYLFAGRGGE